MSLIVSSGLLVLDIRPLSDYQKLLISSNLTFDAIAKRITSEGFKLVKGSLASPAYMQKEFKVDHYESLFDQSQTAVKMPKTDRKPSANIKNIFSMETHLLILNLHNRKDRPDIKSKLIGQWLGWIELNDRPV